MLRVPWSPGLQLLVEDRTMKQGRTLVDLVTEVERQRSSARDYAGAASLFNVEEVREAGKRTGQPELWLHGAFGQPLPMSTYAARQLTQWAEVPAAYADRMAESAPGLLQANLNTWLARGRADLRLVRTLDSSVRAWLSGRYRPMDNVGLLEAAVPTLQELGARVASCEVTEQRLYLKAVLPAVAGVVPGSKLKGDLVEAGLMLSNSEVGAGSLRVEPFLHRLVCSNGMVMNELAMRRSHVGRVQGGLEAVEAILTDRTKQLQDLELWSRVRDVVRAAASPEVFHAHLERLGASAAQAMPVEAFGRLDAVVEVTAKRLQLPDGVRTSVLQHLVEGADMTRWGMANAFTRASQDAADYTLATDLERAGGQVVALPPREWDKLVDQALARS